MRRVPRCLGPSLDDAGCGPAPMAAAVPGSSRPSVRQRRRMDTWQPRLPVTCRYCHLRRDRRGFLGLKAVAGHRHRRCHRADRSPIERPRLPSSQHLGGCEWFRSLLGPLLGNSLLVGMLASAGFAVAVLIAAAILPGSASLPGPLLLLTLLYVPFGVAYVLLRSLLLGMQRISAFNWSTYLIDRSSSSCYSSWLREES